MSFTDFEIIERLGKYIWIITLIIIYYLTGEGAYSSVYKVKRIFDGEIYALKQVKMVALSDKEKENALNEVRLLASIKH